MLLFRWLVDDWSWRASLPIVVSGALLYAAGVVLAGSAPYRAWGDLAAGHVATWIGAGLLALAIGFAWLFALDLTMAWARVAYLRFLRRV